MIQLVFQENEITKTIPCVDKETALKITRERKIHHFVLKGGFINDTPVHEIFDNRIKFFMLKSS